MHMFVFVNVTVLGIYLDLQKAFDTVDHNILLAKLANFGIRGIVYNWFKDYLNDRKQYVCISGTNSECGKITCGVPQGSVAYLDHFCFCYMLMILEVVCPIPQLNFLLMILICLYLTT